VALSRPRRDGTGRWTEYASALGDPYLEFVAAETVASAIIAYAPLQVPELLQVPAYDRASAAADRRRARGVGGGGYRIDLLAEWPARTPRRRLAAHRCTALMAVRR